MTVDQLLFDEKIDEAIQWLQTQLPDPAAWLRLIELHFCLGKYSEIRHFLRTPPTGSEWPEYCLLLDSIRQGFEERDRFYSPKGAYTPNPGESYSWSNLTEAIEADRKGKLEKALDLVDAAIENAPELEGHLDGRPFESVRDVDDRLFCILEAIWEGQYLRLSLSDCKKIRFTEKSLVGKPWRMAEIVLQDDVELTAAIPMLYPNSAEADTTSLQLGLETDFREWLQGLTAGVGSKVWWIGEDEIELNEWTQIELKVVRE